MAVITISRQVAALGDEVAGELAKRLGYKFITRKEIEKRIVELGFPENKMPKFDERKPGFFASLTKDRDEYLNYTQYAILEAAEKKNVVIIGRGAFATGQTYVALSRCRTLKGIHLKKQICVKDILCDKRVCQDLPGVSGQEAEQPVLHRRELDLLSVEKRHAGGIVDAELAVDILGPVSGLVAVHLGQAPDRDPQPGQQLLHGKGLGQIIIRPGIQGLDLVLVLAPGADHDDGHVGPASDLADHADPVHVRQSQIQKHHVRVVGGGGQDRLRPVGGAEVLVIMGLQGRDHQIADGGIVLDHQNNGIMHGSLPL